MQEQFQLWVTSDISSWDSPPPLKLLRRRLTKIAKLAPENATVRVESKKSLNPNAADYTQITVHWYEWK